MFRRIELEGVVGVLDRFAEFVTGITECHRCIQRIKNLEMGSLGLKGSHAMCLFYLGRSAEGLTAARLCELCAEDKAAISRHLAQLEEHGFITAADPDGKKYRALLLLTDKGREAAQAIDSLVQQWVTLGGDGLTDEERAAFYTSLTKIAANLKHHTEKGL